jgi:uncharacterized protein involved in oxidation of intracellular sulfur
MKILLVLNDPPYGSETTYNGLRLAMAIQKASSAAALTVFLMGDAVVCALPEQSTPDGFYNIERMLHRVQTSGRARVLLCGTCMDARGLADADLTEGAARSTLDALAEATLAADRVLVF